MGGTSGKPIHFPDLPLPNEHGEPNDSLVAAYAAIHGVTVNIADAYTDANFDFSGTRKFDAEHRLPLAVFPDRAHAQPGGRCDWCPATDQRHAPGTMRWCRFPRPTRAWPESLASQAAIALNNRLLINQLEDLFESFISLINLAIDEKSPYTGGHCQRVPALTMMLAEAVARPRKARWPTFSMTEATATSSRSPACCTTAAKSPRRCMWWTRPPNCKPCSTAST